LYEYIFCPAEQVPSEDGDGIKFPKHCVLRKDRMVDNAQNFDSYTKIQPPIKYSTGNWIFVFALLLSVQNF
jgi:hypothetical protein